MSAALAAGLTASLTASLAAGLLIGGLASCGGNGKAASGSEGASPEGYNSRTDGKGWAVSQDGLFGHRRLPPTQAGGTMGGIGYAQGSEEAPSLTGVLIHDRERTTPGLNLMHSGDAAEAVLVTNGGETVHRWALPYGEIEGAPALQTAFQIPWRRIHLRPDGSLLAIHSDAALIHLDRESKVRWSYFGRVHHDLDVLEGPNGPRTFALSRVERVVASVNPNEPVLDDLVIELGPDGRLRRTVSLWAAFEASAWAPMLERLNEREGDVMHANSLDLLDEAEAATFNDPAVREGHALVCMRDLDLLAVVDLDAETLVWIQGGPELLGWRGPHDPTWTSTGDLLLFDNLGGRAGHSRILRFAPAAKRFDWVWQGSPPESFSSQFCGTLQELQGGHVLATESCHGRALEIDPATGDIVWEFISDRLAGEDDEFIAALFEVTRIPSPAWLKSH